MRSSISARLAGLGAATFLIAGLFAQATPILAASPGHVAPALQAVPDSKVRISRSRTANLKELALAPKVKQTFSSKVVATAVAKADAKLNPKAAGGNQPDVVGPPSPDPVTSSGAPAAATPVAAAGHTATTTPDSSVAVGPDETLEADTTGLQIRDRAGNALDANVDLTTLFGLPESPFSTFFAHPEVLFDSVHQRWIVSELSWDCATGTFSGDTAAFGHGYIDFAVSDTADPLGVWTFSGFAWPDALPDRPMVGTSTDKVAFTTSLIAMGAGGSSSTPGCASGALLGAEFVAVDWASLPAGFGPSFKYNSGGFDSLDSIRPAVAQPAVDADLRMIGIGNGASAGDVWYVDVAGSAASNTIFEPVTVDLTAAAIIPGFGTPTPPAQSGGTLTSTISGGPESPVYAAGLLAFDSTYPCTPTGDTLVRDCIRVTTLGSANPRTTPTRVHDVLLGTSGFDSSFGGLAWSGNGVLTAVYTQSSSSTFASSVAQYTLPGGGTAWSDPQTLTPGAAAYTGTGWGSYLTVATDPQVPSAVWVGDPAAAADGSWATTIHELVVGDTGAGYVALSPTRVLDTRAGIGLSGAMVANVPRSFVVGNFNPKHLITPIIPANAVAITANLTVTGATAGGYVALSPLPSGSPTTEALTFPTGDNRANNVTIGLAPNGSLAAVYRAAAGKHADLILDVTGYFLAGSGSRYTPITPVRILDSRSGLGTTKFHANVARSFLVAGFKDKTNTVLIPADAVAVSANLTVTNQTVAGHVTVTPTQNNHPGTSTINFPLKDNRANGLTIPIDPLTGKIWAVFTAKSGTLDLTMDVTGYYSAAPSGLLFHPLDPGRRVDTRVALGTGGFGNGLTGVQGTTPRSAVIAGHLGVPAAAAAITGDLTITGQTALGHVTITPDSEASPITSTLNFPLGDTRSNGVTVPLGTGAVWFVYQGASGKHVQVILDLTGYFE